MAADDYNATEVSFVLAMASIMALIILYGLSSHSVPRTSLQINSSVPHGTRCGGICTNNEQLGPFFISNVSLAGASGFEIYSFIGSEFAVPFSIRVGQAARLCDGETVKLIGVANYLAVFSVNSTGAAAQCVA